MKAYIAFLMFFFLNVVLSGIMEGEGGLASTRLTAALTATGTTVTVQSTEGFLDSDYVFIGDERVRYVRRTSTTFIVPASNGRGYDNTEAVVHPVGAMVYSEGSSVINGMLGFNVASTGATVGSINLFTVVTNFAFVTLPKLVTWDFAHFQVQPWLQYIRYVFIIISAGFVIYWVVQVFASSFGGIMQSIFRRP